ncbi:MAG: hypothetical protein IJ057_02180 [Bacteroidales bacterium]|nr:hypothetical protein [Bacteroidales bacterium]
MKKRFLQIGSLLMALVVLFVSIGWDVRFHYCRTSRQLTSSISLASPIQPHCLGQCDDEMHENHTVAVHFESKCCCDDFGSKIQFTDSFTFSSEKHLTLHFQPLAFLHFDVFELSLKAKQVSDWFAMQKIPLLPVGKLRLVFFSQLKLNPLVF